MLAERQIVNADVLAQLFKLPTAFAHQRIEVIMYPVMQTEDEVSPARSIDPVTAKLNEVYAHEDSSLPQDIAMAQYEMFDREPW
ncbi:MAG: hypothetical protein LBM77_00260 [Spirochaetaceae bacterium]|jgi:hypothetical protein|nr:hypothetical protein [Spirochaetaceae bacterium]